MDLGKQVRVVDVPESVPVRQPVREEPIPVENWPIKAPIKKPELVPADAD